jgi:lipopolysaccharide export system permease protein
MNKFNKKLIYNKLIEDTLKFLLTIILSLSLIVWIIQAVNFLDFVTEDGHGLIVYFKFTILNYPKILTELIPFTFFISIYYTLIKYEENNELKIFWLIGIEKKSLINQILKFSLLIMICTLLMQAIIVPLLQMKARQFIQKSNIDYFPSLIQEKKFIDTVSGLTIYIEEKNKNFFTNIFLEEKKDNKKQIIFAKRGQLIISQKERKIELKDGKIINFNGDNYNEFAFESTSFELDNYITKSTVDFKIQEKTTHQLISCFWNFHIKKKLEYFDPNNCNQEAIKSIIVELYKRIFKPIYILLIALITSLLVLVPKEANIYKKNKIIIFFVSFCLIILSEMFISLVELKFINLILVNFFPIYIFFIIYIFLNQKLKFKIL